MGLEDQEQLVAEMNGEGFQVPPDAEPLEFLMAVMRDNRQPMNRRMKAAEAAAQYRHAKLGVVATTSFDGKDFASPLGKGDLEKSGDWRASDEGD